MKINKQLYIRLLEEEAEYQRKEASISLKDMEREQELRQRCEEELGKLFFKNNMEQAQNAKLRLIHNDLNDDFFILGDMFMESKKTIAGITMQKINEVSHTFMAQQSQQRIDYLEELVFDFGDDIEHREDIISDAAEDISDLRKDIEDIQADWAKEASYWSLASKMRISELDENHRALKELKDEIEMKTRVDKEANYADKKCKYDLEQKIIALQKENVGLIKLLGELQESGKTEEKSIAPNNTDVTTRLAGATETENKTGRPKWPAKSLLTGEAIKEGLKEGLEAGEKEATKPKDPRDPKEIAMIACKNKLCNKGYAVKVEGKMLVATKDGTRKIEVGHAEIPGSLKYTVCGQTCFEFEKAVKASVYGVKAILPKEEIETGAVS